MALGAFYVIRRPRAPIASPGLPCLGDSRTKQPAIREQAFCTGCC